MQSVTAVSEVYTTSALALGDSNGGLFITQLRLIVSYLGGSCINGLLNPEGIDWSERQLSLLFSGLLVLLGALYYTSTDWLMCLIAVANGIQNSWTSMLLKENILHTSHVTAASSDVGTYLGQILRGKVENVWKLKILGALIASFWTGGFVSMFAAYSWGELSFLVSVAVYLVLYSVLSSSIAETNPAISVIPVTLKRSSARVKTTVPVRQKEIMARRPTIQNKPRKTEYSPNLATKSVPQESSKKVYPKHRRRRRSMNTVFPFLWAVSNPDLMNKS